MAQAVDPEVASVLRLLKQCGYQAPPGGSTKQQVARCMQNGYNRSALLQLANHFTSAEHATAVRSRVAAAGVKSRQQHMAALVLEQIKQRKALVQAQHKQLLEALPREQVTGCAPERLRCLVAGRATAQTDQPCI